MAWEIISKAEVAQFVGADQNKLRDEWYDAVMDIITERTGWNVIGTTLSVTDEVHPPSEHNLIFPNNRPVKNVTSLVVDGVSVEIFAFNSDVVVWDGPRAEEEVRVSYEAGMVSGDVTYSYVRNILRAGIRYFYRDYVSEASVSTIQFATGERRDRVVLQRDPYDALMALMDRYFPVHGKVGA